MGFDKKNIFTADYKIPIDCLSLILFSRVDFNLFNYLLAVLLLFQFSCPSSVEVFINAEAF